MGSVAVGHAVADADLREDILRFDRVRLDLAADVRHVPIVVATIEGTERIAHNVPWRRTHVYLSIREVIPAETVKATKTNALTEGIRSKMIAELGK